MYQPGTTVRLLLARDEGRTTPRTSDRATLEESRREETAGSEQADMEIQRESLREEEGYNTVYGPSWSYIILLYDNSTYNRVLSNKT